MITLRLTGSWQVHLRASECTAVSRNALRFWFVKKKRKGKNPVHERKEGSIWIP
jgi:hypothetical protein